MIITAYLVEFVVGIVVLVLQLGGLGGLGVQELRQLRLLQAHEVDLVVETGVHLNKSTNTGNGLTAREKKGNF